MPAHRSRLRRLVDEVVKFGLVGVLAFVVDVGLFNLLRFEGTSWSGILADRPVTAKVISATVATSVAYLGNRHWTWRDRPRRRVLREVTAYFALNGVGMVIAVLCLAISHYLLGFTSTLADNVAANGVGLVLGTTFRFWAYRTYVFVHAAPSESELDAESGVAAPGGDVSNRSP